MPSTIVPQVKTVQEVTAQPVRWVIVVSITDPIRKNQVVSAKHECNSLAHARTLLTEIREMAAEFGEYCPGLSIEGYELVDAASLTPAARAVLDAREAANPILAAVAAWLSD